MWVQRAGETGVLHLAYSPDGHTLYVLDRYGNLTAWDPAARTRRTRFPRPGMGVGVLKGVFPLADGRRVVEVGHRTVRVWDAADGALVHQFDRPNPSFRAVRVTGDGRLYSADDTGTHLDGWDVATGAHVPLGAALGWSRVTHFDLTADGRAVALAAAPRPTTVFEWGASGELRNPAEFGPSLRARFAPDGRTLALDTVFGDDRVALWDVAEGQPRVVNVRVSLLDERFAFNPAFPVLAGVGPDKNLSLVSTETGAPVRALDFALGRSVTCVAFAPDGLTCAVGGSNKQFAVFDVDL